MFIVNQEQRTRNQERRQSRRTKNLKHTIVPTIKKILDLLTLRERRRAYLLLVMILIMALLDTIGVASILPFLAVLGNPEVVQTNPWLSMVYQRLGYTTPESFLFFLGLVVFFALVVSISFKALTQLALLRFTHMRNHSLSCRLFEGYLGRPYAWFLNRHSADLGKSILSEVNLVIRQALIPLMQLVAHGTVALFLIVLLILVDPLLALVVAVVLGGSYLLIYKSIRGYMARIGKDRVIANKERYKAAQEALGGIKEVKVFGREKSFFWRYVGPSLRFSRHQANNQVAGQMPMYIMEIVAFGGILLIALYLFKSHGNFHRVLPLLGLYAYAGYRLLPALQQVYKEFVNLRFGLPGLNILHQDLMEFRDNMPDIQGPAQEPLIPEKEIILQDIRFTYPGADIPAIKGLSMNIQARSTVGIVGTTGSGKTTTVDIILGLLTPDSGKLIVDDKPIIEAQSSKHLSSKSEAESASSVPRPSSFDPTCTASSLNNLKLKTYNTLRSWQKTLGYVPQHIYLADETVTANIAFGIPEEEVDMDAVIRAAKIAELHKFITRELPKGYDTVVGERGVRLSGGQRQRIGISRALYHDPAVLIFDEATSSLDNLTEKAVMQAVNNLSRQKTIIMIAHRLTTVQKCDQIFLLEHGQLVAQGSYDELLDISREFRKMATVNK